MDKITDYKKLIKIAEAATTEIADPQLKVNAFQTILNHLLTDAQNSHNNDVKERIGITENNAVPKISRQHELSASNNNQLNSHVYHIGTEGFRIIADFGADLGKNKQIQYVLLHLYANHVLSGKKISASKNILEDMRKLGFRSLPNLNAYLRSVPNLVIVTTKKKTSDNTYEITDLGIRAAKNIAEEISAERGRVSEEPSALLEYRTKRKVRSKLSNQILELTTQTFFDSPKTIKELKKKLEEQGQFYERSILDEKIRRAFLGKHLRRIDQKGKWAYVKL